MKASCDCYVILREERLKDLKILRKLRMTYSLFLQSI
ncbi:MAG: hypothetical protein K0R80_2983 [Clostridia bacterium]|jgi:hypothetical protein|nr:hypothetical protein [Clostridia bacterium]